MLERGGTGAVRKGEKPSVMWSMDRKGGRKVTYHTKIERHAPMDHIEKQEAAKKIAVLLAESTATVDDMFDVFQLVREYLVVTPRIPEGKSYGFTVLDQTRDDDGIGNK